jgi:hypothetical protein
VRGERGEAAFFSFSSLPLPPAWKGIFASFFHCNTDGAECAALHVAARSAFGLKPWPSKQKLTLAVTVTVYFFLALSLSLGQSRADLAPPRRPEFPFRPKRFILKSGEREEQRGRRVSSRREKERRVRVRKEDRRGRRRTAHNRDGE